MRMAGGLFLIVLALVGCEEARPPRVQMAEPGYRVPTAAIIQRQSSESLATAYQVLPASDGDYFIARVAREAIGNYPLGSVTAYSIYTYDAQAISIRGVPGEGAGYRYRWISQQGIASPP